MEGLQKGLNRDMPLLFFYLQQLRSDGRCPSLGAICWAVQPGKAPKRRGHDAYGRPIGICVTYVFCAVRGRSPVWTPYCSPPWGVSMRSSSSRSSNPSFRPTLEIVVVVVVERAHLRSEPGSSPASVPLSR